MKIYYSEETIKNSQEIDRSKIDAKFTWNFNDLYNSENDWEIDFVDISGRLKNYKNYEGRLKDNYKILKECLNLDEAVSVKFERLHLYAMLRKDTDLSDNINQSRYDRVINLNSEISAANAFIIPEILAVDEGLLNEWIKTDELKEYSHFFENLIRQKKHTLSKEQEEIMALAEPVREIPETTFSLLNNSDLKFEDARDSSGNYSEVTHGKYVASLFSLDREYRKNVYKSLYKPYSAFKNTFASLLYGQIKSLQFNARIRKYDSALEAALQPNNIPVNVYNNLIDSVNNNLTPLRDWLEIKKKVLKLDEAHPYDTYVTLYPKVKKDYSYEESVGIVCDALKPLGEQYVSDIKYAIENRWIDVYETRGKRSGAYSSGSISGTHPYILLNWNNQLNDIFTFAHELGHNMHSLYTGRTQQPVYADYSIFVAEVASTLNEALLLDYLIKNSKSEEEKLALIEMNLLNIQTTFYRQTRFAEFEKVINETAEQGTPLTAELLTEIFGSLYLKYWGDGMAMDSEEALSWARIPHFYYNFYVYQYATSYAASQSLVEKISSGDPDAVNKYLNFLKSGSSDYPINLLKNAGVDMEDRNVILSVINRMKNLIEQLK